MKTKRTRQRLLEFPSGPGGKRRGAGRKPKGKRSGVPHVARPKLAARFPVHVTLRMRSGLPSLRQHRTVAALEACFAAASHRASFRLVE